MSDCGGELWCIIVGASVPAGIIFLLVLLCCCCCCGNGCYARNDRSDVIPLPEGPSDHCPFCPQVFGSNAQCATCVGKNVEVTHACGRCFIHAKGHYYRAANQRVGFRCFHCCGLLIDLPDTTESDLKLGQECITNTGERGTVAFVGNMLDNPGSEWIGVILHDGGDPTVQPSDECLDGNIHDGTQYFEVEPGTHARMYRRACVAPMSLIVLPDPPDTEPDDLLPLEEVVVVSPPPQEAKLGAAAEEELLALEAAAALPPNVPVAPEFETKLPEEGILALDSSSSSDKEAVPMHEMSVQ